MKNQKNSRMAWGLAAILAAILVTGIAAALGRGVTVNAVTVRVAPSAHWMTWGADATLDTPETTILVFNRGFVSFVISRPCKK